MLLTGHAKNRIPPGSAATAWTTFAADQQNKGRRTSYVHLVYPIDVKTRHVAPEDSVYVIGMGLTAVDVVKTLTIGRGGRFENGRYLPSGNEPFIILGSRLGLPYSARGYNQKTDQYKGKILLPELVQELKKQKPKIDFSTDLMPCIIREMEYVYYSTLEGDKFGDQLLATPSEEERRQLIATEDGWSREVSEVVDRAIAVESLG